MSIRLSPSSVSQLFALATFALSACSGTEEGPADSGAGGVPAGTTVADGTGGSSLPPGTGVGGASTLGLGGAATGTTTASGIGGASAPQGGASSAGGSSSTAQGGASSAGGTTAKGGSVASGGVTAKGGATASGGMTSAGGATAKGGTSSLGGAPSLGGATAKGGTTSAGGATSGTCTATGFNTKNGKLYDSKCSEFIMRGVNYPYAWFTGQNTNTRFSEIASTRANTVRVVMAALSGTITTAANITSIISWAKANKLIAILELHDCTGYGDGNTNQPSQCLAYWLRSDIINVLKGQEAYVMINIANEAFGNATTAQWLPFYQGAIPQLRTAGLHHTVIVDAPNWGQDWEFVMRDGTGPTTIFNADPDKNTVFSVHMYDVFSSSTIVTNYFTKFLTKGLPFVVGEFAADHGSSGNVDEDTIMSLAAQRGIGYLGWSWSGNSSNLATLDITNNFNLASLTTWGTRLIKGTNGITASGTVCSVYQ